MDFVIAEAGDIYPNVRFIRSIVRISKEMFVFVDQVKCDRKRLLDIAYHQNGKWNEIPDGKEWNVPDKDGY